MVLLAALTASPPQTSQFLLNYIWVPIVAPLIVGLILLGLNLLPFLRSPRQRITVDTVNQVVFTYPAAGYPAIAYPPIADPHSSNSYTSVPKQQQLKVPQQHQAHSAQTSTDTMSNLERMWLAILAAALFGVIFFPNYFSLAVLAVGLAFGVPSAGIVVWLLFARVVGGIEWVGWATAAALTLLGAGAMFLSIRHPVFDPLGVAKLRSNLDLRGFQQYGGIPWLFGTGEGHRLIVVAGLEFLAAALYSIYSVFTLLGLLGLLAGLHYATAQRTTVKSGLRKISMRLSPLWAKSGVTLRNSLILVACIVLVLLSGEIAYWFRGYLSFTLH